MKLYDINTDTFITDRNAIIDVLVEKAADALTYSQRRKAASWESGNSDRNEFLRGIRDDIRGKTMLNTIVGALWKTWVSA